MVCPQTRPLTNRGLIHNRDKQFISPPSCADWAPPWFLFLWVKGTFSAGVKLHWHEADHCHLKCGEDEHELSLKCTILLFMPGILYFASTYFIAIYLAIFGELTPKFL